MKAKNFKGSVNTPCKIFNNVFIFESRGDSNRLKCGVNVIPNQLSDL